MAAPSTVGGKKKKIKIQVKMQIQAGKATPAPPVGSALGPHGINLMEFCKAFNEKTKNLDVGTPTPIIVTVYDDRSFEFITKAPPVSYLLRKAAGIDKGAEKPGRTVVGVVKRDDLEKIFQIKKSELNAYDRESAFKIIAGSAASMGLRVDLS